MNITSYVVGFGSTKACSKTAVQLRRPLLVAGNQTVQNANKVRLTIVQGSIPKCPEQPSQVIPKAVSSKHMSD